MSAASATSATSAASAAPTSAAVAARGPLPVIRGLFVQNQMQLRQLVTDLTDAHMSLAPFEGANDARWVLGHLAVSLDYACSFFGLASAVPAAWGQLFGPGSSGHTTGGPSRDELVGALENLHARLLSAYDAADAATLEKPHGVSFLKDSSLRSVHDFVALLMTTHEAFHIAQLSACRRAAGFKPLF